jgi:hypothetical protein
MNEPITERSKVPLRLSMIAACGGGTAVDNASGTELIGRQSLRA